MAAGISENALHEKQKDIVLQHSLCEGMRRTGKKRDDDEK